MKLTEIISLLRGQNSQNKIKNLREFYNENYIDQLDIAHNKLIQNALEHAIGQSIGELDSDTVKSIITKYRLTGE